MILVVAKYDCFRNWCKTNGLVHWNAREVRPISTVHQLQGYDPDKIIIVQLCGWMRNTREAGNLIKQIQMYRALGTKTLYTTCMQVTEDVRVR